MEYNQKSHDRHGFKDALEDIRCVIGGGGGN